MEDVSNQGKSYNLDHQGFLLDYAQWDEKFAKTSASEMNLEELTDSHWKVIKCIRKSYESTGRCPSVYEVCRMCKLKFADLKHLFPTGFLRGACKLSGISYKEGYVKYSWPAAAEKERQSQEEKTYEVDVRGFLVDPASWDPDFARFRAEEIGIPGGLSPSHWKIINYLREAYAKQGAIPTIFKTCEDNRLDIEELELLFPAGYHRGAVKISGLRER